MTVRPPRNAPPVDPRVDAALDRIAPPREPHRPTIATQERTIPKFQAPRRLSTGPREQASSADLRARADRFASKHAPTPANDDKKPDEGKVLARLTRDDGELRVSLHSYNDKPFVKVGMWQRGRDGVSWWPTRDRAVTVRVRELAEVTKGLLDAMDDLDQTA